MGKAIKATTLTVSGCLIGFHPYYTPNIIILLGTGTVIELVIDASRK